MGYSSDERNSAVRELVQGTLSFPRDKLGPRDTAASYEEVAELARSVFLYDPDAIYYTISLAAKELRRLAQGERAIIDDLLDAVDDLSQPNKPVENVKPLADAQLALSAVDSALSRNGVVGAREVARYDAAMSNMRNDLARSTRVTYVPRGSSQAITDIVRPAPEASAESAAKFKDLKEKHANTMARSRQLLLSFQEFLAVNLGALVGGRQVSRASADLGELFDELDPLDPADRTAVARQSLLRVLANQSVVKGLVNRLNPGESKLEQSAYGSQVYRITASGEGTAPSVEGTTSAPWKLRDGASDILGLNLNGSSQDTDILSSGGAVRAELTGSLAGDFSIHGDLSTPHPLRSAAGPYDTAANGATFYILVDGVLYSKTVTSGAAVTATTIQTDLAAAAGWSPSQPELTFSVESSSLQVAYNVASPPASYLSRSMEIGSGFDAIQDLRPWNGVTPTLIAGSKSTGWDDNSELWIKANDDPDKATVSLPVTGAWPDYLVSAGDVVTAIDAAATASGEDFSGDETSGKVIIRSGVYGEGSAITIQSDGPGQPSFNGAQALGMASGQEIREKDVDGQEVVNVLNNDAWFQARARALLERSQLLSSSQGERASDTSMTVPLAAEPSWPPASELKVAVTGGGNGGVYDLSSYSWVGGVLTLNLGRRLRDNTAGALYQVKVYREVLKITSNDGTTSGLVQASDPANSARTILGFDTAEHRSTSDSVLVEYNDPVIGWKAFDLRQRKIKVTDKLRQEDGTEIADLTALGDLENGIIGVSPGQPSDLSTALTGFAIVSIAQIAHDDFVSALDDFVKTSAFDDSLSQVDRKLSPLLLITPTKDRVDQVYTLVSSLKTEIESLITICDDFFVAKIKGVDRAVKSFADRGLDRARDLLLQGEIDEFFSLSAFAASYGGAFVARAAEVVVQDLNQSNLAQARYDADLVRYAGSYVEDEDPSFDFSDFEEELPELQIEDHWGGIDEEVG